MHKAELNIYINNSMYTIYFWLGTLYLTVKHIECTAILVTMYYELRVI